MAITKRQQRKLNRQASDEIHRQVLRRQFLERQWSYDLCDELGLMVWQEFPLTSSGLENWPPEDEASIAALAEIARSFVERRRHHASLLLWSGGNELQGNPAGEKTGIGKPCDLSHPLLRRLGEVVAEMDPIHRYIPTSPLGPRAGAELVDFGKGLHWDVHGPNASMGTIEAMEDYWAGDDALFRSEVYCSGASPEELIEKYAGDHEIFPANADNPYWTRLTTWWLDWQHLFIEHGREPRDLAEYVEWSQRRQARFLGLAAEACKHNGPAPGLLAVLFFVAFGLYTTLFGRLFLVSWLVRRTGRFIGGAPARLITAFFFFPPVTVLPMEWSVPIWLMIAGAGGVLELSTPTGTVRFTAERSGVAAQAEPNLPPTGVFRVNPSTGSVPLTVRFLLPIWKPRDSSWWVWIRRRSKQLLATIFSKPSS